jgi:asparagine synthase (glutamine-hydrolysing)
VEGLGVIRRLNGGITYMAGITGIIGQGRPVGAAAFDRMVGSLDKAPEEAAGQLRDDALGVRAAWAGPLGSGLAVWSRIGDFQLVYFGENAGEASLESLVWRYRKLGPSALSELNGSFCGILVDLAEQRITLFTDRYGLGRLYCHQSAAGFGFSSQARSLLAGYPSLRQLDPRGLAEYYSMGCVMQNRTLFSGVSILPGGAIWTFHRDGRVEKGRLFDPRTWEEQEALSPAAFGEQLTETFRRISGRYLAGSDRMGLSLTGGLDSRMILAWSHASPGTLPCYTFGGPYRDCADVVIARRLAEIGRQSHTTLRIGEDFFETFPSLAAKTITLSDGSMDVSGAVELYCNRLAREIAPVRLTGNYGSEILRSHVAFRPGNPDLSLFTPEFCSLIDRAAETYRQEAAGHRLSFIAFKQVPWHHYGRRAVECSQLTPRSPFLDNELVGLAYRAPRETETSAVPLLKLIADGNPAMASVRTDRAVPRRQGSFIGGLAAAWQGFTAKAEYACDYGMPGWAATADHAVSGLHLERLFLGRHKFYHFRVWYRDRLRETVQACLGSKAPPSCYRKGAVERIVNGHLSGRSNRTLELHQLLSVQLIEEHLLGEPCPT